MYGMQYEQMFMWTNVHIPECFVKLKSRGAQRLLEDQGHDWHCLHRGGYRLSSNSCPCQTLGADAGVKGFICCQARVVKKW